MLCTGVNNESPWPVGIFAQVAILVVTRRCTPKFVHSIFVVIQQTSFSSTNEVFAPFFAVTHEGSTRPSHIMKGVRPIAILDENRIQIQYLGVILCIPNLVCQFWMTQGSGLHETIFMHWTKRFFSFRKKQFTVIRLDMVKISEKLLGTRHD